MNKYKKELLEKIQKFIDGAQNVPEFENHYYQYYLNEIPENELTDLEIDFFGLIQEKLDWVTENPSEEERKDGWMNFSEFLEFVKDNTKDFIDDENKWHKKYLSSWS